ncbi:transcriptional regulator, Crp/Fnr family [Pseudomonas brassicacearum]|nr:transcriptional regulator, Crp/Fnr family [Pseudomonas brassicacearum]
MAFVVSGTVEARLCENKALWEQGLPAMQATQFYLSVHADAIAGKPCSHKALLHR